MQSQENAKASWTTTFVLVISPLALAEMPSADWNFPIVPVYAFRCRQSFAPLHADSQAVYRHSIDKRASACMLAFLLRLPRHIF